MRKFTVTIDAKGAREALEVLNRACRTWEPRFWPEWLSGMFTTLEEIANDGSDIRGPNATVEARPGGD